MSTMYKVPDPPTPTQYELRSPRGAKLATRVWPVKGKPKALLLLVHGGGFHSGYFAQLAQRLNTDGIFCASYDLVNHGYSEPEPSAPDGYIHINSFDDLVEDLFAAIVWAKQECGYDKIPVFLYGESFGGLQVLEAALQSDFYQTPLAGVIASAPVLRIDPALMPPQFLLDFLIWIAPYYPRTKIPATDMSSTYDEAFGDPQWAAVTRSDPKVQVSPAFTLAGVRSTLATGPAILARAKEFQVPLLALHSTRDCRTVCAATQQLVDAMGPRAEGLWLKETSGHQLLQDRPEVTAKVMDKIAGFIKKHI